MRAASSRRKWPLAVSAVAASAVASACSVPAVTFTPLGDPSDDAGVDGPRTDADPTPDGPGTDAALLPPSCRALHLASPALPSGTYEIDPDGPGGDAPVTVSCDMVADGGGWTIVFVAPSPNLVALPIGYTAGTPRLLADAELALIAFRDAALVAAPNFARFALPPPWRTRAPFNADHDDLTLPVSVNGGAPADAKLRYGRYTFSQLCQDNWLTQAPWGRICIDTASHDSPAPFYAGFSTNFTNVDHCSSSREIYNTTPCSDARRFTIAVR